MVCMLDPRNQQASPRLRVRSVLPVDFTCYIFFVVRPRLSTEQILVLFLKATAKIAIQDKTGRHTGAGQREGHLSVAIKPWKQVPPDPIRKALENRKAMERDA
jgi:hypothetical protein